MKPTLENQMSKDKKKWRKIGICGVDSGRLMIIDPCYATNEGFSDKHYDDLMDMGQVQQMNFDKGHAGKGVVFCSGIGDGCYDVFAKIEEIDGWGERITEVRIVMFTAKEKAFGDALLEEYRGHDYGND